MAISAHPALGTADHIGPCLDIEPVLAVDEGLHTDCEAGESNERGRTLASVDRGQGSPSLQVFSYP